MVTLRDPHLMRACFVRVVVDWLVEYVMIFIFSMHTFVGVVNTD